MMDRMGEGAVASSVAVPRHEGLEVHRQAGPRTRGSEGAKPPAEKARDFEVSAKTLVPKASRPEIDRLQTLQRTASEALGLTAGFRTLLADLSLALSEIQEEFEESEEGATATLRVEVRFSALATRISSAEPEMDEIEKRLSALLAKLDALDEGEKSKAEGDFDFAKGAFRGWRAEIFGVLLDAGDVDANALQRVQERALALQATTQEVEERITVRLQRLEIEVANQRAAEVSLDDVEAIRARLELTTIQIRGERDTASSLHSPISASRALALLSEA